jgi:hypothetical protein
MNPVSHRTQLKANLGRQNCHTVYKCLSSAGLPETDQIRSNNPLKTKLV